MRRPCFRGGKLTQLGGMVNNSLDQMGLSHKILEYKAVSKWKEVVGPQIAASTIVDKVRDGILFVCCKSSVWSNEMSFHKLDIIKRLNNEVGKDVIKDIMFSTKGYRKAIEEIQKERFGTRVINLEAVKIDEEEEIVASKVASKVPSSELAEKIQKAVLSSKRLTKVKIEEGWKECIKCSRLHNGKNDICGNCR